MSNYQSDGGPIIQQAIWNGGNLLSQPISFGTADNQAVTLITNATTAISIDTSQGVTFAGALGAPAGTVSLPGIAFSADLDCGLYRIGANDIGVAVGGVLSLEVKGLDVVMGSAAIATNATSGFFWMSGCAGAATGTPANTFTGRVPMVFDTTNGRLYAYYGAAWKYGAIAT